jgi:hypothetical protein
MAAFARLEKVTGSRSGRMMFTSDNNIIAMVMAAAFIGNALSNRGIGGLGY